MEWTRPLSLILVVLVALVTVGAVVELFRTTLADSELFLASAVTTALVVVVVLALVGVGARGRRWLENPDSYW